MIAPSCYVTRQFSKRLDNKTTVVGDILCEIHGLVVGRVSRERNHISYCLFLWFLISFQIKKNCKEGLWTNLLNEKGITYKSETTIIYETKGRPLSKKIVFYHTHKIIWTLILGQ